MICVTWLFDLFYVDFVCLSDCHIAIRRLGNIQVSSVVQKLPKKLLQLPEKFGLAGVIVLQPITSHP